MSEARKEYRSAFYQNYARLKRLTSVEQLKRESALHEPYLSWFIQRFLPQNRNSRILDLGCGAGSFLWLLQRLGYSQLAGVETSPDQVRFARELGLDCITDGDLLEFLRESATEFYDCIVAFDVLEHFAKDEIIDILDQVLRVLRPGGALVVHVPNAGGIFPARIFWSDFTHETAFTREGLRQLFTATGFASLECAEDKPIVHGVKSMIRRALWECFRAFFRLVYMSETGDGGSGIVLTQNIVAAARKGWD